MSIFYLVKVYAGPGLASKQKYIKSNLLDLTRNGTDLRNLCNQKFPKGTSTNSFIIIY